MKTGTLASIAIVATGLTVAAAQAFAAPAAVNDTMGLLDATAVRLTLPMSGDATSLRETEQPTPASFKTAASGRTTGRRQHKRLRAAAPMRARKPGGRRSPTSVTARSFTGTRSRAPVNSSAVGMHEITGAVVKIN